MTDVPRTCFELEWSNYPRARFFKDRYLSLYPRFKSVTAPLPPCFDNGDLKRNLSSLYNDLRKSPRILLVGSIDLTPNDLVITPSTEKKDSSTRVKENKPTDTDDSDDVSHPQRNTNDGASVIIHVTDITTTSGFGDKERSEEKLRDVIDTYSILRRKNCPDIIIFRTQEAMAKKDIELWQFYTKQKLEQNFAGNVEIQILCNPERTELPSHISLVFEKRMNDCFVKMFSHLKSFMRLNRRYDIEYDNVVYSKEITTSIQSIVCNKYKLIELARQAESSEKRELNVGNLQHLTQRSEHDFPTITLEDKITQDIEHKESIEKRETENVGTTLTQGSEPDSPDNTLVDKMIQDICQSITCAAVSPLAVKYNLLESCCHQILNEVHFKDSLISSFSENTKYYLSEIKRDLKDISDNQETNLNLDSGSTRLKRIIKMIQSDISKIFVTSEKTFAIMERVITAMRKMAFEIKGYLNQSVVSPDFDDEMFQIKAVPQSIRERLLRTDGVFSVATVYGELEIGLTGKSVAETTNKVKSILKDHNYGYPYKVKSLGTFPKAFAGTTYTFFEQGDKLLSPNPDKQGELRTGTLGICLQGSNDTSYGLTCAHVVEHSVSEVKVLNSFDLEPSRFGSVSEDMLVTRYKGNIRELDIAAISVCDDNKCCYCVRDVAANCKPVMFATFESPCVLIGKYVFKYGAKTRFTEGIVASGSYTFDEENTNSMFIVIEALPTFEGGIDRDSGIFLNRNHDSLQDEVATVVASKCSKEEDLHDSLLDSSCEPYNIDQDVSDAISTVNEQDQYVGGDTAVNSNATAPKLE